MESRVQLTANRLQAEHTELQQQLNAEQTKKIQQLANIRKATRAWELMGKPFMRAQCDLTAVADVCRGGSHVSADSQESIQDAVLTPWCVTEVREAALVYCRRGWG